MLATGALAFTAQAQSVNNWFSAYLIAFAIAGLIAYWGVWKMQRWGFWAVAGLLVLNNVVDVVAGQWSIMILVIPIVIVGLLGWKYKMFA